MGARTVDALQCFTFLTDNVPSWITRVTDLASRAAAKHAEFTAEYAKLSATEKKPPRRRKNSSMNTNRDDEEEHQKKRPHSNSAEKQQQQDEVDTSDPLTLLRLSRDRKKEAKGSKNATPARYQVVVHYDGDTQNALELLVRDVGGARNNIRKGRMNQMMKKGLGFRTTLSSHQLDDYGRPMFRSSRMDYMKDQSPDRLPFDAVDKQLEAVQNLCETGAHQFLRFGDCVTELNKSKEHLASVLETAKVEVERLQAEAKEKEEEKDEEPTGPDDPKQIPQAYPLKAEKNLAETGIIEVDDASDASSVSIDMTAFRSSRLRV